MEKNKNNIIKSVSVFIFSFFLCFVLYLLKTSWNNSIITDADVFAAIIAFISPIIGFVSSYAMFNLSNKLEKSSEEKYCKDMLSLLLIHTVLETQKLTSNVISIVHIGSDVNDHIDIYKDLINIDQGYVLVGNGLNARDFGYSYKHKEIQTLLTENNLSNLIFCDDWYVYLKHIKNSEARQIITKWLLILKTSNINSYDFITFRDNLIHILRTSDWVISDIYDLKNTEELCNIFLEESKKISI